MIQDPKLIELVKQAVERGDDGQQLLRLMPDKNPGLKARRLRRILLDLYNSGEAEPEQIHIAVQKDGECIPFADYVAECNKLIGREVSVVRKDAPVDRSGRKEIVVISDLHGPDIRLDLLSRMAAKNEGATLVVAGDFWNLDKLSRFPRRNRPQYSSEEQHLSTREAMKRTVAMFSTISGYFEEIWLVRGNHDVRLANALGMICDSGAEFADDIMTAYLADISNLHLTGQQYMRDFYMHKIGDAWMGHWDCCGKPVNSGANKSIEWMLKNPEVAACGDWRVLVQGHTHKLSEAMHFGKRGFECGCMTYNPDYYYENPGKFSYVEPGYVKLVQYDGTTCFEESGLVRFDEAFIREA